MAQSGYTPIQLYYSTTAAAVPTSGNLANGELGINITDGKLYYKNNSGTVTLLASTAGASGDVVGPASSTDNALARFDLATGKLIQNSVGILSDAGVLTGLTGLTSSGSITLSSLTSGRVPYASTGGLLTDSANLTFNGTTLTANTIGAFTLGGTIAGGGNQINNVIIGTTTPLAGAFTTITANGTAATNTTALTAQGTTTGFNRGRIFNTGGDLRFGIDSSVGSEAVTGSAAYSSFVGSFTNTPFYLVSNSAIVGTVSSTGLAVTGAISATGNISVQDNLSVVLGTSGGAVSISHLTPGTPRLAFTAGGSEKMALTDGGNFGVGTNNPLTIIQANSAAPTLRLEETTTGGSKRLELGVTSGGQAFIGANQSAQTLQLQTVGTTRFTVGTSGELGIGASPSYGTSGQVLTSGGSGAAPTWTTVSSGGSVAGSNTQVQYNNSGAFGASSNFTFTSGSNLTIGTSSDIIGVSGLTGKLVVTPASVAANNFAWAAKFGQTGSYNDGAITALGSSVEGSYTRAAFGYVRGTAGYDVGAFTWYLASNATVGTTVSYTEERMRLDYLGRLGIGTTSATANLARLQVTHDPSTDRYGVYVPGNSYVGSGPSGTQYGGYFTPHTSNSASSVVGVAGIVGNIGGAGSSFGGYFDGGSSPTPPTVGVYGTSRQSDLNGPNQAIGGKFNVNTAGSSAGGTGSTVAVYAQNAATISSSYGVFITTAVSASATGIYYEHNGGLYFRVKSNGGIDNYSGNNTNLSDRREKKDFAPAKSYLDAICAIPVQTFKFIDQEDDIPNLGVVAQDVQAVAPELVVESNWEKHGEEPKMRLSVYETDLMYALMKSIQELKTIVDAQAAEIAALKGAA